MRLLFLAVVGAPVSAVMVAVLIPAGVAHAMIEAVTAVADLVIVPSMKTVVHAWAIRPFVRNAMRWNTPRWPSRNSRHRPMVRRSRSC